MQRSHQSTASAGIALYIVGIFFFAVNDALAKWLVTDYSVGQLLFLRSIGALIVLSPFLWSNRQSIFSMEDWGLKLARVVFLTCDSFSFYIASKAMPLADVITFYLAAPLVVTTLAGPVLHERVGWLRWSAVIVGFLGVVIAMQPTSAVFSSSALVACFGAVSFGLSIVVTRKMKEPQWLPLVTLQFAGTGLIGAGASVFAWAYPPPFELFLMFFTGIVAMGCFACITKAVAMAPASVVSPFQYTSILWGVLLGYMVWGDVPTLGVILGGALIIISGLVVLFAPTRS
jgi:S-adenosylmethionine uptake transporter